MPFMGQDQKHPDPNHSTLSPSAPLKTAPFEEDFRVLGLLGLLRTLGIRHRYDWLAGAGGACCTAPFEASRDLKRSALKINGY